MPYVSQVSRPHLDNDSRRPVGAGELNYKVTKLVDAWITDEGLSYASINAAIGVLECAKLELYRRIAAPYEDTKIVANGDVYTCNTSTPKG